MALGHAPSNDTVVLAAQGHGAAESPPVLGHHVPGTLEHLMPHPPMIPTQKTCDEPRKARGKVAATVKVLAPDIQSAKTYRSYDT